MFPCPVGHISFFSCTAHFPSVSTVSVFPPLLHCCWHIRSMPSAVCPWSLALYPTMSLFSSHAYWNDSADTAHPISVIEMISSPNASMTLLPMVEGKKKIKAHHLMMIYFRSLLTCHLPLHSLMALSILLCCSVKNTEPVLLSLSSSSPTQSSKHKSSILFPWRLSYFYTPQCQLHLVLHCYFYKDLIINNE